MSSKNEPQGLEFPCEYPVKAMGRANPDFQDQVIAIIRSKLSRECELSVRDRGSSSGNFQSVTVTIPVDSREELESIYQALSDCDEVLWTL